jgi:hypothetical protein
MLCENASSIAQTATRERQCGRSSVYILSAISTFVAALSTISTFALQLSDPEAASRQMRVMIDLNSLMERSSSTALLKFLS